MSVTHHSDPPQPLRVGMSNTSLFFASSPDWACPSSIALVKGGVGRKRLTAAPVDNLGWMSILIGSKGATKNIGIAWDGVHTVIEIPPLNWTAGTVGKLVAVDSVGHTVESAPFQVLSPTKRLCIAKNRLRIKSLQIFKKGVKLFCMIIIAALVLIATDIFLFARVRIAR